VVEKLGPDFSESTAIQRGNEFRFQLFLCCTLLVGAHESPKVLAHGLEACVRYPFLDEILQTLWHRDAQNFDILLYTHDLYVLLMNVS